ncbi:MAG TPA: hypothetical protein VNM16_05040 [Bacillota bacterium]|nr:hypothetical protein [Bacillota bacterium]
MGSEFDVPHVEPDGSLSWLPAGAVRLAELRVQRPGLTTVHAAPAEIYRAGNRFFVRRPTRVGTWHTILLDADALGARVEDVATPAGPAVVLVVEA